jgi:hypothetical protein
MDLKTAFFDLFGTSGDTTIDFMVYFLVVYLILTYILHLIDSVIRR